MKKNMIMAATTAVLLWPACAQALDVGVGGIDASVGSDGMSVSVDAGGVSVDAGVGDGSPDAQASAGGISVGVGGSSGSDDAGETASSDDGPSQSAPDDDGSNAPTVGSASADPTPAAPAEETSVDTPSDALEGQVLESAIALPRDLRPPSLLFRLLNADSAPGPAIPGVSDEILTVCQETVRDAAQPYGVVDVSVASQGRPMPLENGGMLAPVFTRVTYGTHTRQARIWCKIDEAGEVSALLDGPDRP